MSAMSVESASMDQPIEQETQEISQPQWSADRRWYWNGHTWLAAPARRASGSLVAAGVTGAVSLVMLVLGSGAALLESNNVSVCASPFGQLAQSLDPNVASQCAAANFFFYGGGLAAFLGGIMLVAALTIGIIGATRKA